jgi:hypothetical protein
MSAEQPFLDLGVEAGEAKKAGEAAGLEALAAESTNGGAK